GTHRTRSAKDRSASICHSATSRCSHSRSSSSRSVYRWTTSSREGTPEAYPRARPGSRHNVRPPSSRSAEGGRSGRPELGGVRSRGRATGSGRPDEAPSRCVFTDDRQAPPTLEATKVIWKDVRVGVRSAYWEQVRASGFRLPDDRPLD